jgi:hypothetical protein
MYLQKVKAKKWNFFLAILKPVKKRDGIRIRNTTYKAEDPDPYQNATDPRQCLRGNCSGLVPTWFVRHVAGS